MPFCDDRYRDRIVLNYSPAVTIREWQQQHRRRGAEVQEEDDGSGDGGDLSAGAPGKSDSVSECPPCLPSALLPLVARLNIFISVFSASERSARVTILNLISTHPFVTFSPL